MPIETYTYFQPDTPALDGGDSAETDAITLTTRRICRALNLPDTGTHYLFQAGNDGTDDWLRVSDDLYTAISPHLTTSELASAVTSEPSGFSESSSVPAFQPKARKKTLIVIGDSLSAGVAATNDLEDAVSKQALDLIAATEASVGEPTDRAWENDTWAVCNTALGSASWANTNAGGGVAVYPQRFDLAFDQRYRTLALNGAADIYIHLWLGTNDLAYDTSLTGAQAWSRAETAIGQLNAEFPNVPILLGTAVRRSESVALNDRLDDYNVLMRANYVSAGADHLVDYETANAAFDVNTGDSTDVTYYSGDGVHLTAAGYAECAVVLRDVLVGL